MNKRRTVFLSSGLPSMFVIFSILCMVILSLLALGTSRQDLQTSQLSLDQTTAYYKACSAATAQYTEITEYIQKTAESASDREHYLSQMKNLEKNFKNTVWSRQSETFSLTLDYSDALALYVEAKAEYAGASTFPDFKIITWKTISTGTWTPDTRQPVYNKGESK